MIKEGDAVICMMEIERNTSLEGITGIIKNIFHDFGWIYYKVKLYQNVDGQGHYWVVREDRVFKQKRNENFIKNLVFVRRDN